MAPPVVSGRSAAELLAAVDVGWNLGNSLDAPEDETAWGNPRVTPELLQTVARRGFGMVRIPITWSLHTGPAPGFTIDDGWLDRVAEVIGYAVDAGMTAIINLHHDGADGLRDVEWLTLNDNQGMVTDANNAMVHDRFVAVWRQIAVRFVDYDDRLLFESMNEVHDGFDEPDPRYYTIINDLNQAFVDVVRTTGGNNAGRNLVVPGYNTNIDYTIEGFELPADTVEGRLILSVHYYDPFEFTLDATINTWGSASPGSGRSGQEGFVVEQFDRLKSTFIDRGIPMIIGEYGAVNQDGFEAYRRYYLEYVTKAAVDRGIVPIYWDNGAEGSGAENLGLFARDDYRELYPDILDALVRGATTAASLATIALPSP